MAAIKLEWWPRCDWNRWPPSSESANKRIKGIKRHVLACSLGFVLAVLVTAANVHDSTVAPGQSGEAFTR